MKETYLVVFLIAPSIVSIRFEDCKCVFSVFVNSFECQLLARFKTRAKRNQSFA